MTTRNAVCTRCRIFGLHYGPVCVHCTNEMGKGQRGVRARQATRRVVVKHLANCPFLLASTGRVAVECPHGFDCCPECDPCTCPKQRPLFTPQDEDGDRISSSNNHNEETDMPIERKEKSLPEFVKITKVGQSVAGRIVRFGKGSLGTYFAIMQPIMLRDQPGGKWDMYGEAAVNLSTDMLRKVDIAKDAGKFLVFNYVENEPTKQGGTKKIFRVLELDNAEIDELTKKSTNHGNAAPPQAVKEPAAGDGGDDDLGF